MEAAIPGVVVVDLVVVQTGNGYPHTHTQT